MPEWKGKKKEEKVVEVGKGGNGKEKLKRIDDLLGKDLVLRWCQRQVGGHQGIENQRILIDTIERARKLKMREIGTLCPICGDFMLVDLRDIRYEGLVCIRCRNIAIANNKEKGK